MRPILYNAAEDLIRAKKQRKLEQQEQNPQDPQEESSTTRRKSKS